MPPTQKLSIVSAVKDYGTRLFRFIRGRVDTAEDAEDILQDVWYQLSNQTELEAIGQVSGWLYRVARNKITDKYKKRKESALDDLIYTGEDGEEALTIKELLMAVSENADAEELKELFWNQLFAALDELPEKQRYVYMQHELEKRTFEEISKETGENIKTLISRKGYAVKHLRNRLQGLYDEFINN